MSARVSARVGSADEARPSLQAARAAYQGIELYAPNRTPCALDLSDNTSLWGAPPVAARAVREASEPLLTRYPSLYAGSLKTVLATYVGVSPDMIVTGCGSDDVLDSAVRAFGNPGDRLAHPDPSFAMLPIFARMNGLEPVAVPLLAPDFAYDASGMLAVDARITYVCAPNNPTGTPCDSATLARFAREAPGALIIDEAYAEFAPSNALELASSNEHVLITRTLSKAFGLAGLRIGYGIGHPSLVAEVEKSRGPYKVSAIAEAAAVAALTDGLPWVRDRIAEAISVRERLTSALRGMGLSPVPSVTNFVLVPVPDALAIDRRLRADGVAVRPFARVGALGSALRISVGPWPLVEQMLAALDRVLHTEQR